SASAPNEHGRADATERNVTILAHQARTVGFEREDTKRTSVLLRGDVPNGAEPNGRGERSDPLARRVADRTNRAVFLDDVKVRHSAVADGEHPAATRRIEREPPGRVACPFVTEGLGRLIEIR